MDSSADYGGGGTTISTKDVSTAGFPQFPGDANLLAHAASQYKDAAMDRLAARGLLGVAQGLLPNEAAIIVDTPLTSHPELPPDHKDYERELYARALVGGGGDEGGVARAAAAGSAPGPRARPNRAACVHRAVWRSAGRSESGGGGVGRRLLLLSFRAASGSGSPPFTPQTIGVNPPATVVPACDTWDRCGRSEIGGG
jgi:hypothetical protein